MERENEKTKKAQTSRQVYARGRGSSYARRSAFSIRGQAAPKGCLLYIKGESLVANRCGDAFTPAGAPLRDGSPVRLRPERPPFRQGTERRSSRRGPLSPAPQEERLREAAKDMRGARRGPAAWSRRGTVRRESPCPPIRSHRPPESAAGGAAHRHAERATASQRGRQAASSRHALPKGRRIIRQRRTRRVTEPSERKTGTRMRPPWGHPVFSGDCKRRAPACNEYHLIGNLLSFQHYHAQIRPGNAFRRRREKPPRAARNRAGRLRARTPCRARRVRA